PSPSARLSRITVTSTLVPLAQSCPLQTLGSLVRCSRQSITAASLFPVWLREPRGRQEVSGVRSGDSRPLTVAFRVRQRPGHRATRRLEEVRHGPAPMSKPLLALT